MDIREQIKQEITGNGPEFPFSFICGGRESEKSAKTWEKRVDSRQLDNSRILHVLTCRDPQTHLEIRSEAIEYSDFAAIEWLVRFKNIGNSDTPILEDIQPLDIKFNGPEEEVVLHHLRGTLTTRRDFEPVQTGLSKLSSRRLSGYVRQRHSGRGDFPFWPGVDLWPDEGAFPCFNLQLGDEGIIFGIGWSGTWSARFERSADNVLGVRAGMDKTHLKLFAGEQIRTPRVLMFFWSGERMAGHNEFRRFILKHHTPQMNGKPVELPLSVTSWFQDGLGSEMTEENQIRLVQKCAEGELAIDCLWMDAGWYETVDGVQRWGESVGNWFPKKTAFPNGLKPVSDEAARRNMGFSLWFEPERVKPGSRLYKEHPEWLLMPDEEIARKRRKVFSVMQPWTKKVEAVFDFGNPQGREWMTDHVSSLIEEYGITIYRQDINFDPAQYWGLADAPDRQGAAEIHHIEGLYEFWDDLLSRHPGVVIDCDSAASADRQCDLETISRTINLYRSDWVFDPEASQSQTMGLSCYYPCHSTACSSTEAYSFRSALSAGIVLCWDIFADGFDVTEARKRIEEFRILQPLFYGRFYRLTVNASASLSDVWCSYQLQRDDLNRGAVVAFRRGKSPYPVARFRLYGLKPECEYEFTDVDSGTKSIHSGSVMLEEGLEMTMSTAPCSAIVLYSLPGSS